MTMLFVYGSLMSGLSNHRRLAGAHSLGAAATRESSFAMLDLRSFPGVVEGGDERIIGELYEVDSRLLAQLDILEGVAQQFYKRIAVRVVQLPRMKTGVDAEMYVLAKPRVYERYAKVSPADWRLHRAKVFERAGNIGE